MAKCIESAVNAYIQKNSTTFKHTYAGVHSLDNWEHFKWVVTFAKVDQTKYRSGSPAVIIEEVFEYKMGMAHCTKDNRGNVKPTAPSAAAVLHSLLLDAQAAEFAFEDWCSEYGYNADSRRALTIYFDCQGAAGKIAKIFTRKQIETLREMMKDY